MNDLKQNTICIINYIDFQRSSELVNCRHSWSDATSPAALQAGESCQSLTLTVPVLDVCDVPPAAGLWGRGALLARLAPRPANRSAAQQLGADDPGQLTPTTIVTDLREARAGAKV